MGLQYEQIENYLPLADSFNTKLNCEIPGRLQPIMACYLQVMHTATGNPQARNEAVTSFSNAVHAVLSDILKDYLAIQFETFTLKTVVGEELSAELLKLERQFDESIKATRQFMTDFITDYANEQKRAVYNESIRQHGVTTGLILAGLKERNQSSNPLSEGCTI